LRTLRFLVSDDDKGMRLDGFLVARTGLTRSKAQQLIARGAVRVDGAASNKNHRLRPGEVVEAEVPPPQHAAPLPQTLPFRLLYQDEDLLVVSKPAGMVVHPSAGHPDGTLVNALLGSVGELSGGGDVLRPGIVHRLDKDTSGLMVVARNDRAHLALQEMIRDRRLSRSYLALVHGTPASRRGTVEAPVGRDPRDRKRMAVTSRGRPAVTHFEVLEEWERASLLHVDLVTGRTHQIRVHLSYIGHAVVGDHVYGKATSLERELGLARQFLHAYRMRFAHPGSGEEMAFEDPLPPDLEEALEKLRAGAVV
jgi:23S rRNA pseudouridine1911/1915/1917 synthase